MIDQAAKDLKTQILKTKNQVIESDLIQEQKDFLLGHITSIEESITAENGFEQILKTIAKLNDTSTKP